jgi:hypothetical protein|tara:strand:+ start:95 stop:313 length:219 start_codon:yes stop_codon:yes gene_type:complete
MLVTIVTWAIGSALLSLGLIALYIGTHIKEEQRHGRHLPLLWEDGGALKEYFVEKRKTFDKSKVKYFDGDNT